MVAANILLPFAAFGMLMLGDSDAGIKIVMWSIFATVFILLCRLLYYIGLLFDNRSSWSRAGGVLSILMAGILLWAVLIGRQHIMVNEVKIQSEQLPEAFDGFRIAHFSDLHIGTLVNQEKEIDKLIDSIMTQSPDLIIFSGDLVNASYKEMTPEVLAQLKKLTAPYGVFSVTGNHDCGFYIKDSLLTPQRKHSSRS